jgi:glycosyltransferase XagB
LMPPPPVVVQPTGEAEVVSEEERQARLDLAINRLRRQDPERSAATVITRLQLYFLIASVAALVILCLYNFTWAFIAITAFATFLYVASLAFRLKLFRLSVTETGGVTTVPATQALSVPASELPTYTVLVPAYREPEVVSKLIASIGRLDYPVDKLQVVLLLEEDDVETVQAAKASPGVERFEIVLVPTANPRTKPKALNYGLQFARGEFVTIYDVEDRPEPLQLRRAVVAMRQAPGHTACVQAELAYYNPTQNLLTRWFTAEYLMWFTLLLPGLSYLDAPVPLGGTSNHFRRATLEGVGAWDPFNVTEDADLGVRLHRLGYRTGVLRSETQEEANSDFVNWVKQRSRWYKGYMQTWLVHMRHPIQLRRELGWGGFARFNSFVAGTPLLAFLNPVFWLMTVLWFIGHPSFIRSIYPAPVFYPAILCWLLGNFACVYVLALATAHANRRDLFIAALLCPLYWVMMSIAAFKAVLQLVVTPSYWEKTTHGLDVTPSETVGRAVPAT